MKIIYDISVLGTGHLNPRARTGVFRVAENIAYGLADSKELDLSFCADSDLAASLDYLRTNPKLKKISLSLPRLTRIKNFLDGCVSSFNSEINGGKAPLPKKISLRVARRFTHSASNLLAPYSLGIHPEELNRADVIHSPFYPLSKQIRETKQAKKFLTICDMIPVLYPNFFESDVESLFTRILSSLDSDGYVTCISHATKQDLCNYREDIDPSKVFVTHLAASDLFYPCPDSQQILISLKRYGIPETPYILSLSTLEPRKNIDHTIRSFTKLVLQENIKDLNLVLVGTKGWNYDKIFSEIAGSSQLKDRIFVTGYVADEDLAALYSGALAFVYPSFYEGFGLPPLEAMQCGIPVITSNTSSLPEVVGDAGIMVSPTDTDALCHSLLEVYNNSSLRASMAKKSLERAKKFSWKRCTQETIAAYKVALSS
ncbi:glycosyltransferase family 1 protein [Leptolyngbya sp. FACHB-261]|uniref:glycosyltransferase family 4 protein n=1 Tax=Leptolyngbya sp. FACHB-261 TaxID=2692806 RepID=UPI00168304D0|nr:glycosyltransferase family 1 protein [Leptolyngbya sp. FACHB-261]MBD2099628.1 glycosyltransferase family 4 protein [Leptolyngbya sp. FACHB-261]